MNRYASWFDGQAVLITGAANGIGRAAALRFAAAGADVAVADVDESGIQNTVSAITAEGGNAIGVKVDVGHSSSVAAMVETVIAAFGRLDCAFNNAGIEQTHGPNFSPTRREEIWDRVMAINLKGIWLCMEYELRHMRARGKGSIVNTASVAGLRAIPPQDIYAASKHGVVGITRAAAVENAASGIRINAIAPGGIRTSMVERELAKLPPDQVDQARAFIAGLHPMGRIGEPEEVADAVLWLCSDVATFTTGAVLAVDGGWLAR